MRYSNNPAIVRVDFFKDTGKWYQTHEMKWLRYTTSIANSILLTELIHETMLRSLAVAFPEHYHDMIAVILDPYHEHGIPIMMHNWWNMWLHYEAQLVHKSIPSSWFSTSETVIDLKTEHHKNYSSNRIRCNNTQRRHVYRSSNRRVSWKILSLR